MILVFIGPPYSGKGTQAQLFGKELNLPVFSMGELIRKAYERKDPRAVEGYEKYGMKGLHLPNSLKFYLLEEEMNKNKDGFILDNYPATQEDMDTLFPYLSANNLKIDKVIYMPISFEEMTKRIVFRNRKDDRREIVLKRREEQGKDRIPVLEYFKTQGILKEINGEGSIEGVYSRIREAINDLR